MSLFNINYLGASPRSIEGTLILDFDARLNGPGRQASEHFNLDYRVNELGYVNHIDNSFKSRGAYNITDSIDE